MNLEEIKKYTEEMEKIQISDTSVELKFFKVDNKEFIVGGIVYPNKDVDAHGDYAVDKEIWKALKKFMINKGSIKVMHQGRSINAPIIENFQADSNTYKGGTGDENLIKKGDWYMSVYLGNEPGIWEQVVSGELTGFSMAGSAMTDERMV